MIIEKSATPRLDLSKLQDRGNKKWVAMMLPEHVALLREYGKDIKREPKPDLDEWDYDAINHTLVGLFEVFGVVCKNVLLRPVYLCALSLLEKMLKKSRSR